jgi:hypothetical protein
MHKAEKIGEVEINKMKAVDTVMSDAEIMAVRINSKKFIDDKLLSIYTISTMSEISIAARQAEISFKAGVKEVLDFIGENPFEHNYFRHGMNETHDVNDCFACKFDAKIKEWDIK